MPREKKLAVKKETGTTKISMLREQQKYQPSKSMPTNSLEELKKELDDANQH